MCVDAEHFNVISQQGLGHLFYSVAVGFSLGGLLHLFVFLREHPSPEMVKHS